MKLLTAPIATVLTIVFAVVGGLAVLLGDELSFNQYLESMTVASAGLAVGRGIAATKVD